MVRDNVQGWGMRGSASSIVPGLGHNNIWNISVFANNAPNRIIEVLISLFANNCGRFYIHCDVVKVSLLLTSKKY